VLLNDANHPFESGARSEGTIYSNAQSPRMDLVAMIRRRVLVEQSLGSVTNDAVECASVAYPAPEAVVVVEGGCGPLAVGASVPMVLGLM
jgi:hypothetical protein